MAFRATKDTYAFERVSPDVMVRRQIFAGQLVSPSFTDENGDGLPDGVVEEGSRSFGLGAAPQAYKHQLDADGSLREEHQEKEPEDQAEAQAAAQERAGKGSRPPEGEAPARGRARSSE